MSAILASDELKIREISENILNSPQEKHSQSPEATGSTATDAGPQCCRFENKNSCSCGSITFHALELSTAPHFIFHVPPFARRFAKMVIIYK